MINSLFKMALSGVLISTSAFFSSAQTISGSSVASCGSTKSYSISLNVANATNVNCQGVWHVSYPNGNTFSSGGSSISVNWGTTPGYGSVSFQGTCTYTTPSTIQSGNNGQISNQNGGTNNQTNHTKQVNTSKNVSVGNGTMPKPYLSGPGHFCFNQTKTFSISSVPNAISYSYVAPSGWSINGGGNTLTTNSLSVSVTSPSSGPSTSTILMKVRANGPNCVLPSAYAAKTVRFGPITPGIVGNSVVSGNSANEYFGTNTEGLVGGHWTTPSSWVTLEDYGVMSQVFQVPSSGSGYVVLSGTSCGVSVSTTKTVTITSGSSGGPTDTGDPIFVGPKSLSGEEVEETEFEVKVYPNPANDFVTIDAGNNQLVRLEVFSVSGQLVLEKSFDVLAKGTYSPLNVQTLEDGTYFIQITGKNGASSVEQISIHH